MTVVTNGSATAKISDYGRLVYVPHPVDGFRLGKLVDIGAETLSVELVDGGHAVKVAYNDALPCEEDRSKDVDDNCGLMYLNEATLLNNCRIRYAKKKIYTYIANILISINPYEVIPGLYADETIREYKGKSLGAMAPHIYAIADRAHRDMKRLRQSQSIIVSGESGAGKTESQKCILRYLCHCFGGEAGSSAVEQRLLETNPILEAFGNAKTVRNNNSSRFGKFVEAHFDRRQRLAGGHVSHYLLEKTRVCAQQPRERNFHVFYQLFVGDAGTLAERLRLTTPDDFNYLNKGCTQYFARSSAAAAAKIPRSRISKTDAVIFDAVVDDCADFERLRTALRDIGFADAELTDLFRTLAAILHLGNVEFDERADDVRGAAKILPGSERALTTAAELLGLGVAQLRMGLTSRMMQPTKGGVKGTLIMVPLKARDCAAARDAFAKAIYSRLFDCVVARINASIPFDEDAAAGNYIGVLDIAGFEFFESNSFEQFCINYCNEKLQHFFNDRILRQEQQLYETEGLNVARIEYSDNQDCIDLFEARKTGLLDLLDEEARLPRASAQHFTMAVQQTHSKHQRLGVARKRKEYREVRDDEAFLVHHYADTVCYTTAAFLEKNNDSLHDSLQMLLEESENSFIKIVLATTAGSDSLRNGKTKAGSNSGGGGGKLTAQTVGSKFRAQLQVLIEKLANTGTHFVRCVKPNSAMTPGGWNGSAILSQLKCAGMTSVLRLMQKGFPSRTPFNELYAMYQQCLPEQLAQLDARMFCRCLFHALGLNDVDYRFGLTKVFFRPGKFAEFDQLMKQDPSDMKRLIDAVSAFVRRARWRKAQYGVWECIKLKNKIVYRRAHLVRLQSALRGTIARRQHRPRLVVLRKALAVADGQRQLVAVCADGFRSNTALQMEWRAKIDAQSARGDALVCGIRNNDSTDAAVLRCLQIECDALEVDYQQCLSALKQEISKTAEEAERIRQLEMEAERQRFVEEAERRERAERERTIQERRALETQRQRAIALDAERNHFNAEKQQMSDPKGQTSDPVVEPSAKLGLIDWTYAKLRDVINTSTNIEFLEACRKELHRRLKAYQEWKIANERNDDCAGNGSRGPTINNGCAVTAQYYGVDSMPSDRDEDATLSTSVIGTIQRYFRVPFEKPAGQTDYSAYFNQCRGGGGGFWYAHFDGQYVARQMELHPSKPPLLLMAGVNDEKMCELSLSETRLTHKKGAEILAIDFETLWHRYGGTPYVPRVGGGGN